ncbi:hypothetical protein Q8A73_022945 [Channa argus]|nr:hypothetical protein Q8A73_022945 [Channa argus]
MAESQLLPINAAHAANAAIQGNPTPYEPHPNEKMLHMENSLFLVNKNNALLQRQIEMLQQENQQLKMEHANILERTRAAPQGFPQEVHYVKNAAIIAYQQNVHLRSQLQSLLQHNQYLQAEMAEAENKLQHYDKLLNENTMFYNQIEQLKSENAKILQQNDQLKAEIKTFSLQNKFLKGRNTTIHQKANVDRNNVYMLERHLKARKEKLQETIVANESQINLYTQHLEMVEEESKFRESTCKEEHSKTTALLI